MKPRMGRDSSVNGVNTLPTHTQGLQYSRYTCSEQRGGDGGRFLAEPFDLAVSSLPGFKAIHMCTRTRARAQISKSFGT